MYMTFNSLVEIPHIFRLDRLGLLLAFNSLVEIQEKEVMEDGEARQ